MNWPFWEGVLAGFLVVLAAHVLARSSERARIARVLDPGPDPADPDGGGP